MRTKSSKNKYALEIEPVNPLAPYIGGKSLLAKVIVPLIERIPHKLYAEPFVGMGGIFFRRNHIPKCEVINDINQEIVTLYRVLERFYPYFIDMMKFKLCSRAEFERLKKQDPSLLLDFERAARFLYLQKTAFGGKVEGQNFGVATERGARFDVSKLIPQAEEMHDRLRGVITECLSYNEFIQKYDKDFTLFYLDPPYWDCENMYGKNVFSKDDFTKLASILKGIKGKFILSINDVPEVRKIFKPFYIMEVKTKYSLAQTGTKNVKELLISNVDLKSL